MLVADLGEVQTSMLQRKLGIGYAKAAMLVDEMETEGIIGPPDGAKPRKLLKKLENIHVENYAMPRPVTPTVELEPTDLSEFDEEYLAAVAALPPNVRKIVERLGWKLKHEGLTLDEACLLCNVVPEWIERTAKDHPVILRIFQKKELEWRTTMMKPLMLKAKNDDKMAMFMLELRYPKQKGRTEPDDSGDMLAAVINHIQEHGDSSPLVSRSSNTALVVGKGGGAKKLMDKIAALIPGKSLV